MMVRSSATPAGGIQTNTRAQSLALAGLAPGATMWHPRMLQYPNRHMLDGGCDCGVGAFDFRDPGNIALMAGGGLALIALIMMLKKRKGKA